MKNSKTRTLCEAAMLIALAQILSYIKLYEFPNGGSVDCAMVPIILFAVRHGCGWGAGVGFVYGFLQSIGCHTQNLGIWSWSVYAGTVIGGVLRFLAHYVIGAVVWGKWMPDTFFGMTMTSPWFYSLLYNGSYMLPDILICLVIFALLYKPLKKYFTAADLQG